MVADEWREIVEFYVELIERHRQPVQETLDFVRWLAESEHAWMHPSQSLTWLGLSPVRDYGDRLTRPMVYLEYAAGAWELVFQEGQGRTVKTERVDNPRAEMPRVAEWLRRDVIFSR